MDDLDEFEETIRPLCERAVRLKYGAPRRWFVASWEVNARGGSVILVVVMPSTLRKSYSVPYATNGWAPHGYQAMTYTGVIRTYFIPVPTQESLEITFKFEAPPMRHNIRGLLSDPATRKALLDRATQGVIAVGADGTHPVKDNEPPMNKTDIFAALTAYLDTHGGPDALKDFFAEYERSIGVVPAPIVDTLIVLGDGETWDSRSACSFVDVTEEERTEILEGRKVKNVADERRWRPIHDTREVWVLTHPDGPPFRAVRTEAAAQAALRERDWVLLPGVFQLPLIDG